MHIVLSSRAYVRLGWCCRMVVIFRCVTRGVLGLSPVAEGFLGSVLFRFFFRVHQNWPFWVPFFFAQGYYNLYWFCRVVHFSLVPFSVLLRSFLQMPYGFLGFGIGLGLVTY